uniref:hypothetical protein n=1 Tax=Agathobacter sp. TaxID=2021311 RepID=UPI00405747F3
MLKGRCDGIKKKIIYVLCLTCMLSLLLCGCPSPLNGEIEYEIAYPDGEIRGVYSYAPVAIGQTGYQLDSRSELVEDGIGIFGIYYIGREYADYLQILDETGTLLYEYAGAGNDTLWGFDTGDGSAWVSSEDWITSHYNGYRSYNLTGSLLLQIDLASGDILFQQEIEAYQMYLTTKGDRCYFYDCGEESEERLFGLFTTAQENARIFYRDIKNWEEEVTVYTFDYAVCPDIENIDGLRFSLEQEDEITVLPVYRSKPAYHEFTPFEGIDYVIPLE